MSSLRMITFAGFALLSVGLPAAAQRARYTSPPAQTDASIGGKEIKVEYYAPSMHGRKVMGGLVPYGQVWCTGANWATKITTPSALQVGGIKLPAGSYSIWTIPNEKEWTLIINKETGQFHLNYNPKLDFARTPMNVKMLPEAIETFKISVTPTGGNNGQLALIWERTEASVPLTVLP